MILGGFMMIHMECGKRKRSHNESGFDDDWFIIGSFATKAFIAQLDI